MADRRIAVDARPLCHPGTGIYRYTHELLVRLCPLGAQWYFYSPQRYDTSLYELPNVHHRIAGVPSSLRASQMAQIYFPRWLRQDRVDALWGPRHQLPLLMSRKVNAVVTIHDLVWKVYGDTMRFPGRQIENFFTPRALDRADAITVVSDFTRQQLAEYFPQVSHKVTVVPGASMLGARDDALVENPAARGDYFLFVGTLEPRKNLPRLLRAYRRYVEQSPSAYPLKIAGGTGWGDQDIALLVSELGLSAQVELLGRVDDDALRVLYSGAYALLMPSLYEGFGLPVVEALSAGVPVITSRNSAMSEVAGQAGLYVDPCSEDEILAALMVIASDRELYLGMRRHSLGEAGRYDWTASAHRMAELLLI